MTESHYEVVGVEPTATRDEIRDAYRARVDELKVAREAKNVSDATLAQNRDAVAQLNTAWNVLSDPYQRGRYDQQLLDSRATVGNGNVELVDDEVADDRPPLTGWRKVMAPSPRPAGRGSADNPRANRRVQTPPMPLPAGMRLADTRSRGMAMLTDFTILLVLVTLSQALRPVYGPIVNSRFDQVIDQAQRFDDRREAAERRAERAADRNDDQGERQADRAADRWTDRRDDLLEDELGGVQLVGLVLILGLALAYLVPATARRGQTFGKRLRRVKVVRVDGSPVGWGPSFVRYGLPLAAVLVLPMGSPTLASLGPLLGIAMVVAGLYSRNGQGFHDRIAKTIVVAAD